MNNTTKLKLAKTKEKNSKNNRILKDKAKTNKTQDKQKQKSAPIKQLKKSAQLKKQPAKITQNNVKNVTAKSNGNKKQLKVMFLGGVGEIGKNMTVLEYDKDIIVIDAGVTFPGASLPGVDLVMPDISYLTANKHKIKGFVITHGHEDHIGALPYVLKEINPPIYGTKLTLTLIENKLKEHRINSAILNCIKPTSVIKLGCFSVEFVNVNHSIAGAVALSITTPVGVVFHSGDFKIDFTPVNGETANIARIAEIGKKGVTLLLAESTNVEIPGSTMSEAVVKDTLEHYFTINLNKRLTIATFASNVHRLQQILDLAVKYKRKVAFSGRSMINIVETAEKIGELSIADKLIVDIDKTKNLPDGDVLIITTGTQGEPMSALTRMASGEFNKITIGSNDVIIISASVIPGNEKMLYGVINNLYRLGAEVIYESLEPIHVSGHACQDELKLLHQLIKPKYFIPVHGEYRHLKKHQKLATELGMKEANCIIADIGDCVAIDKYGAKKIEPISAGARYIDGLGVDGADSFTVRDRIHLSEDGVVVAVVSIGKYNKVNTIEIISKGVVADEKYFAEIKANLANALEQTDIKKFADETDLSSFIRRNVRNYIFKTIKKNPMIIPIVTGV